MPASVLAAGGKRTTSLDLTTQETKDSLETEGWAWDAETKTLTLNGLNLETAETPAVTVPAGTTIILAAGSENSITTTASAGVGIFAKGSLTIKTAEGAVADGKLTIKAEAAGTQTQGIALVDAPVDNTVAFYFSDVIIAITARRGIQMYNTDNQKKYVFSMDLDGVNYTFANNENVTGYRSLQVWNDKNGDSSITVKNSTINATGGIYCTGRGENSKAEVNIVENSSLNINGIVASMYATDCITNVDDSVVCGGLYSEYGSRCVVTVDNSTVMKGQLLVKPNNGGELAKLVVNNSNIIVDRNQHGWNGMSAIEVGVNYAVASEAILKNSTIIAVIPDHSAISVSRKPGQKEDGTTETNAEARGNLVIENCEVFLADKDKKDFTHLDKAKITDSDITSVTVPQDDKNEIVSTITWTDSTTLSITVPAGSVLKSDGEAYTTTAETVLTLNTENRILSVPEGTKLTTADGEITTEGIMTIAPGQVLSAEDTVKISANISSSADEVVVDTMIFVSVNVSADGNFNAAQLEVTYPADSFTFNEDASTLHDATVTAENGVVKLVDYGEAKNYGNGVYTLAFTATKSGDADFALVSAGFGTLASAETDDLTKADCYVISTAVTVKNNVRLDSIYNGEASVYRGDAYTFGKETSTGAYYDYELPTATIGGVEATVIDNGNGTWTVENVTGELVITGNRTPKTHKATVDGENAANDGASATYLTDYTFTLKDNVPAGLEKGYNYTVESVTIGGVEYRDYTVEGRVYTIPGTDIIGDVVVKVKTTELAPNKFSVTAAGNGAGAATLSTSVVDINNDVTLTVPTADGYVYTVTAAGYEVEQNGNVYTVKNVTTAVEFNVSRVVDIEGTTGVTKAEVSEYVTLDGTVMWLVTIGDKIDNKVYTYNGQNMFWSDKYETYATLVVSTTQPVIEAANFDIVTANAITVNYSGDVNMTGSVDANDAQLVWNMYKAQYSGFTDHVTLEKFLRADVNGDKKIDVTDATAIVNSILKQ